MPIYDWNGTDHLEIGQVYDWNGTDHNQIGAVYDWNGTDHNLIYTSDYIFLDASTSMPNTWDKTPDSQGTVLTYTVSGGILTCSAHGYSHPVLVNTTPIDVTDYKTMIIRIANYQRNDSEERWDAVGLYSSADTTNGDAWFPRFSAYADVTNAVPGTKFFIDISNLTGKYYFKIQNHTLDGSTESIIALDLIEFSTEQKEN